MNLRGQDEGYAMAVLLVALAIMTVLLAVAMPTWKQMAQREKEEELIFRGQQYARAIGLFQRKYANAFPPNFDVLVREKFLRRKYKDPITNDDFAPLTQAQGNTPGSGSATAARPGMTPTGSAPTAPPSPSRPLGTTASGGMGTNIGGGAVGGIIGVTSKSKDKSIRIYNGRTHYNEWAFIFTPQMMGPGGVPGAPGGVGRPGQPGQRGQPGGPGGFRPGGSPNPQRPGGRGEAPSPGRPGGFNPMQPVPRSPASPPGPQRPRN